MTDTRNTTRFELARREIADLRAPGRQTLLCERGEVWITFDGCGTDIVLKAGETLQLAGCRDVVISALQPARLSLSGPAGGMLRLAEQGMAPWRWARRLRWKFPALASFPATQLR